MAKILLVEDDKSLREIYGVRLMAEGYEIVSAGDGEEALAMAIKERPDLIVSDVMMPKISGFDMLDILRSTTETKDVKVIMMTALSSEDQRARGEALGADRYLVKSQVGIEDVVRTVHDVLGDGLPAPVAAPSFPPAAAMPAPAPVFPAAPTFPAAVDTSVAPTPFPQPVAPAPAPIEAPVFPEPVAVPVEAPVATPAPAVVFPGPVPAAPALVEAPAFQPAPVAPTPVAAPVAPTPFPQPVAPAPAPIEAPVFPEPVAPVAPVDFFAAAPVPAPTPEPAFVPIAPTEPTPAPFQAPAPFPAPAPATMPLPTAPFSSPAPASLGERVIAPITDSSAQPAGVPDLATQMEQALNSVTMPPTLDTPPTV